MIGYCTVAHPRLALPAALALIALFYLVLVAVEYRDAAYTPSFLSNRPGGKNGGSGSGAGHQWPVPDSSADGHAIDELIRDARLRFKQVLEKRSTTLEEAAQRYRERRGRHPPPGFDVWFAAAQGADAVVVEDFFDRIHHDTNPFWAMAAADARQKAAAQPSVIHVRDGKVSTRYEGEEMPYRVEQWARLVGEMARFLPDLDMPVNTMDESRVIVPWEEINDRAEVERKNRQLIPRGEAMSNYGGVGKAEEGEETGEAGEAKEAPSSTRWIRNDVHRYWDHLVAACPPDSPARETTALKSHNVPVEFPKGPMPYTYHGYVQNFTAAQDPCQQPHLRGMHGTFIEPVSMSLTHELLPLFGESKLPANNEMLIPSAVYLDDSRTQYSGGRAHGGSWADKQDRLIWRGASSGARNKAHNWWHIHRHRFVQMLNGTTVSALEAGDASLAKTFELPATEMYALEAQQQGRLGEWVSEMADVGFTDILCEPPEFYHHWWHGRTRSKTCEFAAPYFSVKDEVSMKGQYGFKFLPDVDGQSFSGRYRAFLLSTSAVLKSTIYAEWHDDRLFPWVHFVPLDNTFSDVYGIMDYFLNHHRDEQAERIATEGREWASTVLRREDMKLYLWRLLLEYARVIDDNRDRLAFVQDLTE